MGIEEIVHRLETGERIDETPVVIQQSAEVTAGEIRKVVATNPSHPLVRAFRKGVHGLSDEAKLYIDRNDLLGIATNREVVRLRELRGGALVITKQLGDSLEKQVAQTTAPPTQTEEDSIGSDS